MSQPVPPTKRLGRPAIRIDLDQLEELAAIQCTYDEIAAVLRMTKRSLITKMKQHDVLAAFERGRARGKESVRRAQYKAAVDGNATAMIWWGKQYMGQRDARPTDFVGGTTLTDGQGGVAVEDARAKLRRLLESGAERLAQTATAAKTAAAPEKPDAKSA